MRPIPSKRRSRTKAYRLPAKTGAGTPSKGNREGDGYRRGRVDAENLIKSLAFVGASLYVLGLVSVNGYLFNIGITDFALIRARFMYTGALLIGVGFAATFPLYVFALGIASWRFVRHTGRKSRLGGWLRWRKDAAAIAVVFGISLLSVFLSVWMLYLIPWPSISGLSFMSSKVVYSLLLIIFALFVAIAGTLGYWMILDTRRVFAEFPAILKNGVSVFGLMIVFLAFVGWMFIFMIAAYPNIPEQFGGGRARLVRVLLEEESVDGARELGIPITEGTQLSAPVNLIYNGSETYVIGIGETQIVQLDKSMVLGIASK